MEKTHTGSNPNSENHRGGAAKICSGEGGETQITLKKQSRKIPNLIKSLVETRRKHSQLTVHGREERMISQ